MYSSLNENKLIFVDVAQTMSDSVSIQLDMDETKLKAAQLAAIRLHLRPVMSQENINRCIDPLSDEDDQLRQLVIPALCWYTYGVAVKLFSGSFSDSGYVIDEGAENGKETEKRSGDYVDVGTVFMQDVLDFLNNEESLTDEQEDILEELPITPRIRHFGGNETRSSN